SHVVDQLLDAGAKEVVVFDKSMRRENLARAAESSDRLRLVEGDVTDRAALGNELTGVHGLFHLAVLPIGPCDEHPRLCFEVNVGGTVNVLEAAHEAGVEKVVVSSASSLYGDTLET